MCIRTASWLLRGAREALRTSRRRSGDRHRSRIGWRFEARARAGRRRRERRRVGEDYNYVRCESERVSGPYCIESILYVRLVCVFAKEKSCKPQHSLVGPSGVSRQSPALGGTTLLGSGRPSGMTHVALYSSL